MEVSSGVAQENYWKERMEISPAYIGIWGYYQEYRYDETDNTTATTPPASPPTKEGLRWIVIQVNYIILSYLF